jgi:SAM-dependent methyltransferase
MIAQKVGLAQYTPMPVVRGPLGLRLEPITVEWHRAVTCLAVPTNFTLIQLCVDGMKVDEARNKAIELARNHQPQPEFIFSLDYDVIPSYDAITKLIYRARCYPDYDIFAGVYCCKSSPPEPLIYRDQGSGGFWDWTVGDLLTEEIVAVPMGLTLIRMSLFGRLEHTDENPWFKTTEKETIVKEDGRRGTMSGTEDIHFCHRAINEAGAKILVDTSVLAGHVDHRTGQIFGLPDDSPPIKRCPFMGRKPKRKKGDLRALDIGAGHNRREWPGYRTYTLDIRTDVKPDFVQDTRWLNFPDNHWDMVASSHHLEHIGRWDQERVWSEMVRILKPGGKMQHIIPNIEWAAWKIMDKQVDDHCYNVLYGAQEAHEYARDFNTHYFGYTPAVAKALAEQAGLVDVTVTTYEQQPELGYNLVVRGTKPKR